jgi:hypothetical protein
LPETVLLLRITVPALSIPPPRPSEAVDTVPC